MRAERPVALITGSAARIGAAIARHLHNKGFNIVLHYQHSVTAADELKQELNKLHQDSCISFSADLLQLKALESLVQDASLAWGRLDALVNNASGFYPKELTDINEEDWHDLLGTNARAPLFLSRAAYPALKESRGCIVNITDIAAMTGRESYSLYSMAKAALENLTKSLARELAPEVRVNAVAPGFILPPNISGEEYNTQASLPDPLSYSCLSYPAKAEDIAKAVYFLITQASYITGQSLSVDGGRKLKF